MQSTVHTVDVLSGRLLELWRDRRADPHWIAQSPMQWAKWKPPATPGFEGYTKRGPTITNKPGMQTPPRQGGKATRDSQRLTGSTRMRQVISYTNLRDAIQWAFNISQSRAGAYLLPTAAPELPALTEHRKETTP